MAKLVAFLGSINVGGNRLKMADLKAALANGGLENVETVVASGNVLFSGDPAQAANCEERIHEIVLQSFGIDSLVVVRTPDQIGSAVEDNPFHGDRPEHGEDKFVHSIFLDNQPRQEAFDGLLQAHRDKGGERLALGERVLFLDYVHGVGVSSLTGKFLERHLDCRGTARNMRSLKRILEKLD